MSKAIRVNRRSDDHTHAPEWSNIISKAALRLHLMDRHSYGRDDTLAALLARHDQDHEVDDE